jgi:hypothetical protein
LCSRTGLYPEAEIRKDAAILPQHPLLDAKRQ